jgi:hypothetical protein
MKRSVASLVVVLLVLPFLWPVLWARQSQTPKVAPKKRPDLPLASKPADPPAKPPEQPSKRAYAELTIGELAGQDPNRWTETMATHAAVSGFVTLITKADDGDVNIRICENPKVEGMDRGRCVAAACIPKLPCDLPQIGKPITVKGITRYDAAVGNHWWEINPVEQVEK